MDASPIFGKKNIKTSNDQLTQEDFGEILFEDYDPEKINEIIYHK